MQATARPHVRNATAGVTALSRTEYARSQRLRASGVIVLVVFAFASVSVKLVRLASSGGNEMVISLNEPIADNFSRPDIVDRSGRLLATDIEAPSLYADPALVQGREDVIEKLTEVIPGFTLAEGNRLLGDPARRFAWIRRGVSPSLAQTVHNLGIPGLQFRNELKRAYPLETLAGHLLGEVNVDNHGQSGLERYIDDRLGVEAVHGATLSAKPPLRIAIDIGVQHSLQDELRIAMGRFDAKGASGVVMDIATGEVLASASLPGVDPARAGVGRTTEQIDRINKGRYELGSVWKIVTVAMALDSGKTTLDTMVDVRQPLEAGKFVISDLHPVGQPITLAEVFLRSSNVGAGMLALEAGPEKQKAFIQSLGLWDPMVTEVGAVTAPEVPASMGRIEQITLAYGHGIAVAPIQFTAACASLLNGGRKVVPTFLRVGEGSARDLGERVVGEETSRALASLMRRNVTDTHGTGRRADVPGYRVGGKTGTAEMAGAGGYQEKSVISSFLAAFPTDAPKYVVLVSLFEPKATQETDGEITAGRNAAPTAADVIRRIAPLLGVRPVAADLARAAEISTEKGHRGASNGDPSSP